jgi:cell division septation protein DedD
VVVNPGFETGSLSPWTSCGSVNDTSVTTAQAHSGSYSALIGTTAKPEVDGTAGLCQTVTVPSAATLTFWVYEGTTDTIEYVDQEADILSTSGSQITQLYSEADTTNGWVEKSFSLGSYAGETVQLYFGVKGNGYSKDYVYEYLDDVSLTGSSATATPSASPSPSTAPTATPTFGPTASPTAKPTSTPSATPSASPTATASPAPTTSPSTAPYACNNTQFLNDQSEFAAGTITADQLVDICGSVTQVLAAKKTSSGDHGYFYVEMPSGYQIEIVSNLDAMAEAPTDDPPSTWPWVAVNDYVYVQGRYYYDSSSSQGVDWTEDDTDSSWSHVGYVVVCNSSGASCSKYW